MNNSWKCNHCNIEFTNKNEYQFHIHIECPNKITTPFYMMENHCLQSKKYRYCYRCGRLGHYYKKRECYATTDIDGNNITWGEKQSSKKKYKNHRNKNMLKISKNKL
tara:strand:- start:461 stop:781 length:321 start_codon:yes stop_codon:yes gene_type:complete